MSALLSGCPIGVVAAAGNTHCHPHSFPRWDISVPGRSAERRHRHADLRQDLDWRDGCGHGTEKVILGRNSPFGPQPWILLR